jgi:orotate phosphoribosyltransferase-like protein
LSTKADQLEWLRSKVVEMRARGLSQTEIARELFLKEYVTEYLPEQFQICEILSIKDFDVLEDSNLVIRLN